MLLLEVASKEGRYHGISEHKWDKHKYATRSQTDRQRACTYARTGTAIHMSHLGANMGTNIKSATRVKGSLPPRPYLNVIPCG